MALRSRRKHPPRTPLPSDAELDILAAVWRLGPSTVREIHEALAKDSGYTTTLKQMQLMTEKGLLVRSDRFRSGCVAKTILSVKPNRPPMTSVDYSAFNPRISRMN